MLRPRRGGSEALVLMSLPKTTVDRYASVAAWADLPGAQCPVARARGPVCPLVFSKVLYGNLLIANSALTVRGHPRPYLSSCEGNWHRIGPRVRVKVSLRERPAYRLRFRVVSERGQRREPRPLTFPTGAQAHRKDRAPPLAREADRKIGSSGFLDGNLGEPFW